MSRRQARRMFLAAQVFLAIAASHPVLADDYADARTALVAAYQDQNYVAMRLAADKALDARPGYPPALFNLALAEVLDDDPAASFDTLRRLLAMQVDFDVANVDEFAPLQRYPEWADYEASVELLYVPVGQAEVVATLDVADFVPEGIAMDATGAILLGSVRNGNLVRLGESIAVVSSPQANNHWSVFGMRFDDAGRLWFASAAVPQFSGDGNGETGLFALDPDSGKILVRTLLPAAAHDQVLGDLVIDGETIYTTDSLGGALYRYDVAQGTFDVLVAPGVFGSPQGLVLDEAGEYLYVADYVGGLFRVPLDGAPVEQVTAGAEVTLYGIDGLYRHGQELIAIQNGVRPHRVVALTLDADGTTISGSRILAANLPEFDEPTLGFVAGNAFCFVANSHWNRFDARNQLPDGLSGPIVLKLLLP